MIIRIELNRELNRTETDNCSIDAVIHQWLAMQKFDNLSYE